MTKAFKTDVQLLPKELNEKVVKLHFIVLGSVLTVFAQEHADYISVKIEGPVKVEDYSYRVARFSRGCGRAQLAQLPTWTNSSPIELVPVELRMLKKFLGTVSSWTKRL